MELVKVTRKGTIVELTFAVDGVELGTLVYVCSDLTVAMFIERESEKMLTKVKRVMASVWN